MSADYENRPQRELDRTDPSGNQTIISPQEKTSPSYRTCGVCDADCMYLQDPQKCWGETILRRNEMLNDISHTCEGHSRMHGSPQGYYMSEPTTHQPTGTTGPALGLGEAPPDELSNWGGEFTPENDDLKNHLYRGKLDKTKEDPHYTM